MRMCPRGSHCRVCHTDDYVAECVDVVADAADGVDDETDVATAVVDVDDAGT
jgi:hypothetical protein